MECKAVDSNYNLRSFRSCALPTAYQLVRTCVLPIKLTLLKNLRDRIRHLLSDSWRPLFRAWPKTIFVVSGILSLSACPSTPLLKLLYINLQQSKSIKFISLILEIDNYIFVRPNFKLLSYQRRNHRTRFSKLFLCKI